MNSISLPRSWKEQFELAAAVRHEKTSKREELARVDAADRQREDVKREKKQREELEAHSLMMWALASSERVTAFRTQLDHHDTATVDALMDNQVALDALRQRLDDMLDRAHVLPDGRRVFLTEDGRQVFDERGRSVTRDELDPSNVDPRRPRWEEVQAQRQQEQRLLEERRQLHDYQGRLDRARERLDQGEITQVELDRMQSDLTEAMPEAVRRRMAPDAHQPGPSQEPRGPAPAMPDDMDALMRQTGLGAPPITPRL